MSILTGIGGLLGAVVLTTTLLPLAIVKDVATLGGTVIDEPSATVREVRRITETISGAAHEMGETDS